MKQCHLRLVIDNTRKDSRSSSVWCDPWTFWMVCTAAGFGVFLAWMEQGR